MVTVRDFGCGMPREKLDHVFEPFANLRSGFAGANGSGLGLWLMKQLIESQGGHLVAQSGGCGAGCKFSLVIPAAWTINTAAGGSSSNFSAVSERQTIGTHGIAPIDSWYASAAGTPAHATAHGASTAAHGILHNEAVPRTGPRMGTPNTEAPQVDLAHPSSSSSWSLCGDSMSLFASARQTRSAVCSPSLSQTRKNRLSTGRAPHKQRLCFLSMGLVNTCNSLYTKHSWPKAYRQLPPLRQTLPLALCDSH